MHQQAIAAAPSQDFVSLVSGNTLGFRVPENYSAIAIS
jgi:hypothetical protein